MSVTLEQVYDHAPIWVQNVMTNVYGLKVYRQRYGKTYHEYQRELARYVRLSREEQQAIQLEKLRELVAYAMGHSPFYRELYSGFDVRDIRSLTDLRQLPIVTKEMLRANIDRVITIPRKGALEWHTGGTTGKSLVGLRRVEDMQQRMATLAHFKAVNGFVDHRMRRATFNGKHIVPPEQTRKVFWRDNWSIRQRVYSSFQLTEENLLFYVQDLQCFKPHSLDGFPSSIAQMATFIERNGIELAFRPVAIFPTSETVTPARRELIERVFRCPVRDQYASSEGAPFVTECPNGNLHYDTLSGVIEHRSEGSDEILVTSFTSYGAPLIRYAIGDSMVFASQDEVCDCGNNTPLVKSIQGRASDYLVAADGARIIEANLANVLKNLPNSVVRAQFVQDVIGEVVVRLVVEKSAFGPTEAARVQDELQHKFGRGTRFRIEIVEDIPREASGKYRFVKNNMGSPTSE